MTDFQNNNNTKKTKKQKTTHTKKSEKKKLREKSDVYIKAVSSQQIKREANREEESRKKTHTHAHTNREVDTLREEPSADNKLARINFDLSNFPVTVACMPCCIYHYKYTTKCECFCAAFEQKCVKKFNLRKLA